MASKWATVSSRKPIAAGKSEWPQMAEPVAPGAVDAQQFATPEVAIRPEADTVDGQTDHRLVDAMFGADRGNMCVMVRHGQCGNAALGRQPQRQMG